DELDHADRDDEQLGRRQPIALERGQLRRVVDELPEPERDEHPARDHAKRELHECPLRELNSSYAIPVATAYTVWWNASIAISSFAQKIAGGAMSSAGSVT